LYAQVRTPKFTKRRRSPAPAIIIAIVVLLLGCWIFNVTCGGNKKEDTTQLNEYANLARSIAEGSTSVAQAWNSVQGNLPQLISDPDNLSEQLKQIEQQCSDLLDEANALQAPESVRLSHAALLICLEQRYRATKNYRPDLINALTAVDVDVYAQSISEDLQELVYSDGSYRFFKRSLSETLEANNITEVALPDSIWLANWDDATQRKVESFLVGLKGTELHGLALGTVVLDPQGDIVEEGGESVHLLPPTDVISITVNIENQGNRTEENVKITVSLYSVNDPAPTRQEQTIENIAVGENYQVVFEGLRPKTGGIRNVLEVKVEPVPKEAFLENNEKLIYFSIES
jgi:hypothetical protein